MSIDKSNDLIRRRRNNSAQRAGGLYSGNVVSGQDDRFNWPIADLAPYTIFDWADGDGLTPDTGPSLTASGTVTSGQDTSLVGVDGDRISQSFFGPGDLVTPASIQITGEDIVMIGLADIRNIHLAGSRYLCRFHSDSGGVAANPSSYIYFSTSNAFTANYWGSGSSAASVASMSSGLNFVAVRFDQSAGLDAYCNGNKASFVGALGMSSAADGIIYLAINSANRTFHMHRMMVFQGPDIADIITDSFEKNLRNTVLGIGALTGDQPTFERDSQGCTLRNSKYYLLGHDCSSSGDGDGIEFQPQITQKVYNNANPQNTTGWSETSGGAITFTVADDSAQLGAASDDLSEFGPNVFHIANSTGGTEYIYSDNTLGNTNAHSLSCFARIVSGSANLGLRDASAGTFSNGAAISGSYARTKNENITPPDTDCALCLEIPDGFEGYVALPQAEEFWCCTAPIPNYATAATVTRENDEIEIDSGSVLEFDIKYHMHTGNVGGSVSLTSDTSFVVFDGENVLSHFDGSTYIQSAVNVCDGAWHHVRLDFTDDTRAISVDGETPVYGLYDGDSTWKFGTNTSAPFRIKSIKTLRNNSIRSMSAPRFTNDQSVLNATTVQIKCPAGNSVTIEWGDGSKTSVVCDGTLNSYVHNYSSTGTYHMGVIGDIDAVTDFRVNSQSWISGDISSISGMTSLTTLYLHTTSVSGDISSLSGMTSMIFLVLSDTSVSGDISSLSGMTSLTTLYLHRTSVSGDISSLSGMASMVNLSMHTTSVSGDISALSGMTSMIFLYLYNTSCSYSGPSALPPWPNINVYIDNIGLSTADLDQFLIDIADGVGANVDVDCLTGNGPRSSASDAAVTAIIAAGGSVT